MIKTITVEQKIVVCDLCGRETGYDGDQGYAQQKKHFCKTHHEEEQIWQGLEEYPKSQAVFFEEAKSGKTEIVEEKKSDVGSRLHSSITHV